MADADPENTTPLPEPANKRRKLSDSAESTPRYSSPERDDTPDESKVIHTRNLSIRRGRPASQSASRSRSRSRSRSHDRSKSRTRSRSREDTDGDEQARERYYSSSQSRSPSRSRSISRTHHRSRTRSQSDSRSRSRSLTTRRRTSSTPSGSGSGSGSGSSSSSDSRSRSRSRTRTSTDPHRPGSGSAPLPRPRYRLALSMKGHAGPISQVRLSPDGRYIASASADGTARVWDARDGSHRDTLAGHMAGISCIAWSPDSSALATGSDDKAIRLWDRVTANPAHGAGGGVGLAAHGHADGRGGTSLSLPSSAGRRLVRFAGSKPLLGHHNYVYCVAFSPKGNILASGSYDEAVFLWDVRAGRLMRSLPAHSDPVSGIDFSRDGTLVASCSTDGLIRIWDTSTGQCLRTLVHEDNPAVSHVVFSPNGRYVLAFNLDSCIRLWDYVSGTVKKTYQGHANEAFSVGGCFGTAPGPAPASGGGGGGDGRGAAFVASASEDGCVVLWDVVSKREVGRLRAHDGVCFWVDVHADTLVSAGQDGFIRVFRIPGSKMPGGAGETQGIEAERDGGLADNGHGEAGPEPRGTQEPPQSESPLQQTDIKVEDAE